MSSISKSFGLSSSLEEEEVMVIKKQGIVERSKSSAAVSLRRTLSADMSSKKWLSQHPLKKIASSEEFPVSFSEQQQQLEQFDIWTSMLSQKQECNNHTPYVHPLVKRSASSLTGKSLDICTESLGSETGSDGFSSEKLVSAKSESEYNKKSISTSTSTRSFPPPIPSLSRGDGASVHMRPRRDNGRLVLEAVSVPSQNNFRAERQDGRLVLTFINNEEVMDRSEEVEAPKLKLSGGVMNVHRLALMMNKSVVLSNRTPTPTWSNKFNNNEQENLTQSLPPRPPVARMISNAYEYYWKAKPSNEKQELLVFTGNNYLLPLSSKGCKEPRRSLFFWDPYCIAT
ncbi:protein FAF-like, chloroplastic [Euphorbia lathyris]|uniref:protein FAF-like, chloroplastic n=1 Tax=Euphorbia lathyris TaxID=212925 RepID=UPI0033136B07